MFNYFISIHVIILINEILLIIFRFLSDFFHGIKAASTVYTDFLAFKFGSRIFFLSFQTEIFFSQENFLVSFTEKSLDNLFLFFFPLKYFHLCSNFESWLLLKDEITLIQHTLNPRDQSQLPIHRPIHQLYQHLQCLSENQLETLDLLHICRIMLMLHLLMVLLMTLLSALLILTWSLVTNLT